MSITIEDCLERPEIRQIVNEHLDLFDINKLRIVSHAFRCFWSVDFVEASVPYAKNLCERVGHILHQRCGCEYFPLGGKRVIDPRLRNYRLIQLRFCDLSKRIHLWYHTPIWQKILKEYQLNLYEVLNVEQESSANQFSLFTAASKAFNKMIIVDKLWKSTKTKDPNPILKLVEPLKQPLECLQKVGLFNRISEDLDKWVDGHRDEIAAKVEHLEFYNEPVEDLTYLTHCKNLKFLEITNGRVFDLWPLSSLIKLEELQLVGNCITDIYPLKWLVKLRWLNLDHNFIKSIGPVSVLTKLFGCFLQDNRVEVTTPLLSCKRLIVIDVTENPGNTTFSRSELVKLEDLRELNQGRVVRKIKKRKVEGES